MNTKKCSKCKEEKSLDLFGSDKSAKDGLNYWCKACITERSKEYNQRPEVKERERIREQTPKRIQYREDYSNDPKKKEKSKKRKKEYNKECRVKLENRLKLILSGARNRANKRNIYFDLGTSNGFDWLLEQWNIQIGCCLLTGIKFDLEPPKNEWQSNPYAPSLDRIDSSKGYTKENTRLICLHINLAINEFGINIFDILIEAYKNNKINTLEEYPFYC